MHKALCTGEKSKRLGWNGVNCSNCKYPETIQDIFRCIKRYKSKDCEMFRQQSYTIQRERKILYNYKQMWYQWTLSDRLFRRAKEPLQYSRGITTDRNVQRDGMLDAYRRADDAKEAAEKLILKLQEEVILDMELETALYREFEAIMWTLKYQIFFISCLQLR